MPGRRRAGAHRSSSNPSKDWWRSAMSIWRRKRPKSIFRPRSPPRPGPPARAGWAVGTIGLWVGLDGGSFLDAGLHHLECRFDHELLREQLAGAGINTMKP